MYSMYSMYSFFQVTGKIKSIIKKNIKSPQKLYILYIKRYFTSINQIKY